MMMWTGKHVPPIHDITTDTANPPAFVAVLPLRASARNSVEYGGDKIASQQKSAYPEIQPLHLTTSPRRRSSARSRLRAKWAGA